MTRVLTVINWLVRGGIETRLLHAAPILKQRGIHVDFCCLGGHGTLDDEFRAIGCQVHVYPRRLLSDRGYREVSKILNRTEYHIVHSRFGFTSAGIARAAAKHGVPLVVSLHDTRGPLPLWAEIPIARTLRAMYIRWQLARTLPKAYKFYGVSESCLDAVDRNWRKQPELFSVIKNGVLFPELIQDQKTARSTLGLPLDRPCVLHIGSFKYQKNHLGLLRIHRYLLEHHPDALLVLVGSGSLRREIEAEVHSSNLENSVVFMGEQRDVWPFYAAADTFLLPSFFEGMPNVLIEALGAGVPIVASRIPEHCEIVPHSQWDFLFPLPEYKQAAAMIASRLTAPRSADRTNFGTGNTIREAFSMESHINALESLYSGCSRRNPGIAA